MTTTELNEYIKHYLENDMTHTAIMLTGEWGSGKTHYIEHELMDFLNIDKKNRCITVSLYGLVDVSDISKNIYMEIRSESLIEKYRITMETKARWVIKKYRTQVESGKLFAKAIIKGVIGKVGFDVNVSDKDLQKIYESVDLTDKLLILEDLERSNIDIVQLLGYVNNLVERDGVKVLLVANEDEILQKEPDKFRFGFTPVRNDVFSKNEENKQNQISEDVRRYLRIKEKTISDTICFEGDCYEAVKNIIENFKCKKLNKILSDDIIKEIVSIIKGYCNKNLRTFIFATQKTVDIFGRMKSDYEDDFLTCVYLGIIYFSAKIKANDFPRWEGAEFLSTILGSNNYPLFKFCYNYIRWQRTDFLNVEETRESYSNFKLYDEKAGREDADLQILYNYYEKTEIEVRKAIGSIEERLKSPESIGVYNYGKLAAYLVKVSHVIGFDYTQCKECMIANIKGKGRNIDACLWALPLYEFEESQKKEFDDFVGKLMDSMNLENIPEEFSYNPNDMKELYECTLNEISQIRRSHEFISRYNIEKVVEILFCSSPQQIQYFRWTLSSVYKYAGKSDYIAEDRDIIRELIKLIQEKTNIQDNGIDKIQLLQLQVLCRELETYSSQMS